MNFDPNSLIPIITRFGTRLIGVVVLLFLVWIISGWISSLVRKSLVRANFDKTLTLFFTNAVRWMILLLGALACLSIFGVQTTSFAAVIGAAGLAIGLAFQGSLSNLASGVMLLVFRPFKVGDAVKVCGETGKIVEITIFTTLMDTFDNRRIILPNSQVFGGTIENITFHPTRRVDVTVGTDYGADLDKVRETLKAAIATVEGIHEEPKPAVALLDLGDSSINWACRVWTNTGDFWPVKDRLTRAIKMELDKAGIGIPFPQMDIHVDGKVETAAK